MSIFLDVYNSEYEIIDGRQISVLHVASTDEERHNFSTVEMHNGATYLVDTHSLKEAKQFLDKHFTFR